VGKYIVRNGDLEGRKLRLESGAKIVLGRERADMSFFDKRMSRRHCTIEVRDGVDFVRDLGSTNGTWVNNQRITEAELKPGDLLRVGFTELEFLGNPEPAAPVLSGEAPIAGFNPNQTIAFRAKDLVKPPTPKPRKRLGGKSRLADLKSAAMGKKSGQRQYISAKGKFCEACGEAIFVKEGAPDEGTVVDGLYLCRMCALISEKQKQLGKDGLMMNFAKVVHGQRAGGPASGSSPQDSGEPMEIIEEEVSLEDLTASDEGEETAKVDDGPDGAAGAGPEALAPEAESPPNVPTITPAVPEVAGPMKTVEEEARLDFDGPDPDEKTAGDPAVFGVNSESLAPAAEAPPDVPPVTPTFPEAGGPMKIVEEEASPDSTGPEPHEKTAGDTAVFGANSEALAPEAEAPPAVPTITPAAPEAGDPMKMIEEEADLDFKGPEPDEKTAGAPAVFGATSEALAPTAEVPPDILAITPAAPEGGGPMKITEEESSPKDLTSPGKERGVAGDASPALPPRVADEAPTPTDTPEPPSSEAISIPDVIRFEEEPGKPGRDEKDDVDSGEGDGVA